MKMEVPIKHFYYNSNFIILFKCTYLEHTAEEHKESHFMTCSIIYTSWIAKTFVQILFNLWNRTMQFLWQYFSQFFCAIL